MSTNYLLSYYFDWNPHVIGLLCINCLLVPSSYIIYFTWTFQQHTMNIFDSKSGHLSNRIIERFFFIFSKLFAVFDDFSKYGVPNVLQNSEKSSNIAEIVGKWRKSCNFYYYFNGHFCKQKLTKNRRIVQN